MDRDNAARSKKFERSVDLAALRSRPTPVTPAAKARTPHSKLAVRRSALEDAPTAGWRAGRSYIIAQNVRGLWQDGV